MYEMADAFVVLPGGYGTMDELMEVATWDQLGFHSRPIVLANVSGFFDPFLLFLDRMLADGFIGVRERELCRVAVTADECLDVLGMTSQVADSAIPTASSAVESIGPPPGACRSITRRSWWQG